MLQKPGPVGEAASGARDITPASSPVPGPGRPRQLPRGSPALQGPKRYAFQPGYRGQLQIGTPNMTREQLPAPPHHGHGDLTSLVLHEGEGERVLALESREGTRASRRVEEGLSRSFSGLCIKPRVPLTCACDLRELLRVPLRSQGQIPVPGEQRAPWWQ